MQSHAHTTYLQSNAMPSFLHTSYFTVPTAMVCIFQMMSQWNCCLLSQRWWMFLHHSLSSVQCGPCVLCGGCAVVWSPLSHPSIPPSTPPPLDTTRNKLGARSHTCKWCLTMCLTMFEMESRLVSLLKPAASLVISHFQNLLGYFQLNLSVQVSKDPQWQSVLRILSNHTAHQRRFCRPW